MLDITSHDGESMNKGRGPNQNILHPNRFAASFEHCQHFSRLVSFFGPDWQDLNSQQSFMFDSLPELLTCRMAGRTITEFHHADRRSKQGLLANRSKTIKHLC